MRPPAGSTGSSYVPPVPWPHRRESAPVWVAARPHRDGWVLGTKRRRVRVLPALREDHPMSRSTTVTLLTTQEAADVLTITVSTLNAWRCRGGGPPWLKIGQCVRYDLDELKIWIGAQRQVPDRPQQRL